MLADAGAVNAQSTDPLRIELPTVVVTAQKEPTDVQQLPVSVTAVSKETLTADAITSIGETAIFAPNTLFTEFSARKLSFPHFRGISGGPGNPAITTYVDGVPMIHTNASSVELLDVEQVELVRGGQSALYGRNALGGIINVASTRPSLSQWIGAASAPLGNYDAIQVRGSVSGPVTHKAAISVAAGRSMRNGFTTNTLLNEDIDSRANTFAKGQLLWTPASNWEIRAIVGGEHARDGDYALADLGSLERNPFETQRDFDGYTDRDVVSGTFLAKREGGRLTVTSTTGIVNWSTTDATDLDYSPLPLLTRSNAEEATQFTQEVRVSSATNAPVQVGGATLRWQAGVFIFTQGYDQDAVNTYSPYVLSPQLPFSIQQHSPTAALDDQGIGFYGQGTFTLRQRLDVALGGRVDHESKDAALDTFFTPAIAPPNHVVANRSFSNFSPQASLTYRVRPDRMVYGSVSNGYKAGGFNPASPVGAEAYGEEHTWQVEGGVKTTWGGGRMLANAAVFYINWEDLQLNVPNPQVPAQFYVANVGGARSAGVEAEVSGRVVEGLELFGVVGYTNGRFKDGSVSSGVDVAGNALPSTPDYTATFGARYRHTVTGNLAVYARGDVALTGSFDYDDANTAGQDAYSLTNLRAGLQKGPVFAEAWIKNAFDTRYVPVAFAYPDLAPSGFVGEMGHPRTYGVNFGVQF